MYTLIVLFTSQNDTLIVYLMTGLSWGHMGYTISFDGHFGLTLLRMHSSLLHSTAITHTLGDIREIHRDVTRLDPYLVLVISPCIAATRMSPMRGPTELASSTRIGAIATVGHCIGVSMHVCLSCVHGGHTKDMLPRCWSWCTQPSDIYRFSMRPDPSV
jgi:hypothetical protein